MEDCYVQAVVKAFDVDVLNVPRDPKRWSCQQVMTCLQWIANKCNLQHVRIETLSVYNGYQLMYMGRECIISNTSLQYGEILWSILMSVNEKYESIREQLRTALDSEFCTIWHFILDLLYLSDDTSVVSWKENPERQLIFQIHDYDELTRLWRIHKDKASLTKRSVKCSIRRFCQIGILEEHITRDKSVTILQFIQPMCELLQRTDRNDKCVGWKDQFKQLFRHTHC